MSPLLFIIDFINSQPKLIWLFPPGGLCTFTDVGTPVPSPAAGAPPNFPDPLGGGASGAAKMPVLGAGASYPPM